MNPNCFIIEYNMYLSCFISVSRIFTKITMSSRVATTPSFPRSSGEIHPTSGVPDWPIRDPHVAIEYGSREDRERRVIRPT